MEKQTSGALPLVKLQPLSPNELTHPRSSSRSRFSVFSLIMPSAPALARAVFELRCPSTSLPFTLSKLAEWIMITVSTSHAVQGSLYLHLDEGQLWLCDR